MWKSYGFSYGKSSTIGWFATSLVYPRVQWSAMWIETDDFASKSGPIFRSQDHQHWINWLSVLKTGWRYMAMNQYLLIPFLVGWTSIYQLFWCSPGVPGFDTLPYSTYSSPVQESWRKSRMTPEKKLPAGDTSIFFWITAHLCDCHVLHTYLQLYIYYIYILSISFPWLLAKMCVSV